MAPLSREKLRGFLLSESDTAEMRHVRFWVERELGIASTPESARIIRAMAAVKAGVPPEAVAKLLDWKEFEAFCATLFRAKGFRVAENITMTKPRGQVDLLARSSTVALAVDCKHWGRTMGASTLSNLAEAQARRADMLRKKLRPVEPIIVVILILSDEPTRYANGAAVVPIYALGNFADNVDGYAEGLPRH